MFCAHQQFLFSSSPQKAKRKKEKKKKEKERKIKAKLFSQLLYIIVFIVRL